MQLKPTKVHTSSATERPELGCRQRFLTLHVDQDGAVRSKWL